MENGKRPTTFAPMGGVARKKVVRLAAVAAFFTLAIASALLAAAMATPPAYAASSTPGTKARPLVPVLTIKGDIELGVSAYIKRGIEQAEAQQADALLLHIDTPGGRLDAALAIKDALLDAPLPTIALIDSHAFSAGALIALACQRIYMVPGGVIGAATPVKGAETASEKTISGVRKAFAATAEARDRDPVLAEAMVDPAVRVEGVSEAGKLLTLTHKEAMELGMIAGIARTPQQALSKAGYSDARRVSVPVRLSEQLVRFITGPKVAPLLLSFAMLAMFLELKAPGWGVAGLLSLLAFALVFWGHHLAGLAGSEDIWLFGVGLALLALEIFVIPGTGIAGVLGGLCLLASFVLMQIGDPGQAPRSLVIKAAANTVLALSGAVVGSVVVFQWIFRSHLRESGLFLTGGAAGKTAPATEVPPRSAAVAIGAEGETLGALRPAGYALFDGESYEVVARSGFIPEQTAVTVVAHRGRTVLVKPTAPLSCSSST